MMVHCLPCERYLRLLKKYRATGTDTKTSTETDTETNTKTDTETDTEKKKLLLISKNRRLPYGKWPTKADYP